MTLRVIYEPPRRPSAPEESAGRFAVGTIVEDDHGDQWIVKAGDYRSDNENYWVKYVKPSSSDPRDTAGGYPK